MNKSKKRSEEPWDRLSELPDSLIFEIFWLLPMREVVRTTILSKRWNNLWTTTPYLNFDRDLDLNDDDEYHDTKFIDRALIFWKGFRILKFKFGYNSVHNKSVFSDIDVWVRLAKENGVEELYLEDSNSHSDDASDNEVYDNEVYGVPHYLYSCTSLKVLSLIDCKLQIHGNMQWNQLKSLKIEGPFLDQNLISKVISGSPQLEVFILNLQDHDGNLVIRSTSLKELYINRQLCYPSIVTELIIWSPNLETLYFVGVPYSKYSLVNVTSLTHLALDFSLHGYIENGFVGEKMGQILQAIRYVEKLTILDWCLWSIKELRVMKEKYLQLSPLSNFKLLKINASVEECEEIVDILQVERNLPKSFLLQLRTVEFTRIGDEDFILTFVEFVLKHASKLQKMVIRISKIKRRTLSLYCLSLQKKLLRMPRSSPTAEVVVIGY